MPEEEPALPPPQRKHGERPLAWQSSPAALQNSVPPLRHPLNVQKSDDCVDDADVVMAEEEEDVEDVEGVIVTDEEELDWALDEPQGVEVMIELTLLGKAFSASA